MQKYQSRDSLAGPVKVLWNHVPELSLHLCEGQTDDIDGISLQQHQKVSEQVLSRVATRKAIKLLPPGEGLSRRVLMWDRQLKTQVLFTHQVTKNKVERTPKQDDSLPLAVVHS